MSNILRLQGRWSLTALLIIASLAFVAVACGDDDDDDSSDNGSDTPDVSDESPNGIDYGDLGGEVSIDGSSTVFPISEAVAEEFSKISGTRVTVGLSGTGGGFEKFCRGEIEVSDASRPIKDSEVEECAGNGIDDIVELQVAIDALTVMVSPDNDWATCMTTEQLNQVFRAGGASKWSDIDASWPDDDITLFYPGPDSGTFDYFNEAIIEGVDETSTHNADGTPSEDDNVLAVGIKNDKNAMGYFGFAYFLESGDSLKAVEVDNGDGCVAPSFDAALDGSYAPLSRPLFIYTTGSLLAESEELLGFIDFYLNNIDSLVPDVGYVTMPADLVAEQTAKVEPFLP